MMNPAFSRRAAALSSHLAVRGAAPAAAAPAALARPMSSASSLPPLAPDAPGFAANQRQPTAVRGDWQRVLAAPEVELISSGFVWTEGPVWLPDERALYFTDVPQAKIFRWTAAGGSALHLVDGGGWDGTNVPDIAERAEPGSNGMCLDPSAPGWVYVCQHPTHRVVRARLGAMAPGSRFCDNAEHFEVVCDSTSEGVPLNSPNDVVTGPDGAIWFTDPPYGHLKLPPHFCDEFVEGRAYLDEAVSKGAGVKGVYRVPRLPGGGYGPPELATGYHPRPNGLAFGRDCSTLWVADSSIRNFSITGYPVDPGTQVCLYI